MFDNDFILIVIFAIIGLILVFSALFAKAFGNDKDLHVMLLVFGSILLSITTLIFTICWFVEDAKPKAIDVYREKTSLIIEGKDSTVVFGHPTIEHSLNQE